MQQIRAFIAIEIPDEIKIYLEMIQVKFKQAGLKSVKWVEPANLHLTLKFLGNISHSQIQSLSTAMQSTAHCSHSFQLCTDSLGAFPNLHMVQVIWIGMKGELESLFKLQHNLEENLAQIGFMPEKRAFKAHLTLGRMRDNASLRDKQELGKQIQSLNLSSNLFFEVNQMHLIHSQLLPSGPVYTRINSFALAQGT